MNETQLHSVVTQFLKLALPDDAIAHHSPNEGKRGWKTQRDLKRFGTVKGWPDIEIVYRGRIHFLELKAPGRLSGNSMKGRGHLSPDQRACHQSLRDAGALVATCWSLDDVQRSLTNWGIPLRANSAASLIQGAAA